MNRLDVRLGLMNFWDMSQGRISALIQMGDWCGFADTEREMTGREASNKGGVCGRLPFKKA